MQWGGGRLFDAVVKFFVFFTKTAIIQKRKVKKSFQRLEMNSLSEGYKRGVDNIWDRMAKIVQGAFFYCSAQKTTKYKEKLKYQNCSANCSSQKILSTRKKQSIRTETTAHVYSCISTSRVSKHFLQ